MNKGTLNAPTHSPGGDPTLAPSNSAPENEGLTRTGGGSCSEMSSNSTCIEIQSPRFTPLAVCTFSAMKRIVVSKLEMLLQAAEFSMQV